MPTLDEAEGSVKMSTVVLRDGVSYSVSFMKNGIWQTTWQEFVPFGRLKWYRPAGAAFKKMARQQERVALDRIHRLKGV